MLSFCFSVRTWAECGAVKERSPDPERGEWEQRETAGTGMFKCRNFKYNTIEDAGTNISVMLHLSLLLPVFLLLCSLHTECLCCFWVEFTALTAANSQITPHGVDESVCWHLLILTKIAQSASGCQQTSTNNLCYSWWLCWKCQTRTVLEYPLL